MTNRALFALGHPLPADDVSDQKYVALAGQTYQCSLRATSGVSSWQLQVYDAAAYNPALPILGNPPRKSKNAPDLVLTGTSSGSMVSALTPLSAIDLSTPEDAGAHSWIVRSVVNGGMSGSPPRPDPDLVHERIVSLAPNGLRKPVVSELRQYEDDSWAGAISDIVDALAGGDGLPVGSPGDLLYVDNDNEWAMLPIGPAGFHLTSEQGGSGEANQPAWGPALPPGTYDSQPLVWNGSAWVAGGNVAVSAVTSPSGSAGSSIEFPDPTPGYSTVARWLVESANVLQVERDNVLFQRRWVFVGETDNALEMIAPDVGPPLFGALGAAPVARQSITGENTQTQVDSLVAALVALGFVTDDR